ncbi:MAG: aminodeoxychorismate synthase component I [Fimbriimonadales bacterium]|nr:aminodeoxychorismate synthase component I [Fimbriimonadales bacterium]
MKYPYRKGHACWLWGERLAGVVQVHTHSEVLPALAEVEQAVQRGLTAIGYVAYEASHGLDKAFPQAQAHLPLVWFGVYERLEAHPHPRLGGRAVGEGLDWRPTLTESAYHHALLRIRDYIEAGDVYQVNYSFRLRMPFVGDTHNLFWQLYHAQPVPYAAYIDTGEHVILSLSPELFFVLEGERITSRPMKGTAPRGVRLESDLQQAQSLRCSEKNRAENLMIVDMVRNDLGRIAKTGTVCVPQLFETERYATLWQMTSTVEAKTDAPLPEIFRALFPAASITGAPKIRASQIIHELETTPRGVYTGAVGVVLPDRRAQFNVAIRTLVYDRAAEQLEYGVGSGVVWDSEKQAEYQECLAKAQVILKPRPEFELLETILWRAGKGYFLVEKHLERLQRSAEYFGFKCDGEAIQDLLCRTVQGLANKAPEAVYRIRLLLNRVGEARLECAPLEPKPRLWRVALAPKPVDPSNVFLYHKTTNRMIYEQARAACPDCDDVILWNPRGEVTESTIANVVVKLNGRRYTPPISCGLLGGVYREYLLERGRVEERVITIEELQQAEVVYLINSVRGRVRAVWARPLQVP